MVRFLLYANEWDIKGLIHSSSKYHWKGDSETPGKTWEPVEWLDQHLDAYEKVFPNLKLNDDEFPTPDYLRSQVFVGNIAVTGDTRTPTPGSEHIVKVLLDPDTSPVWLQAWGGSNTIARALMTIHEKYPERVDEVAKKARIYLVTEQDMTLREYIRPVWPEIQVLRSGGPSFGAIAYAWKKLQPKEVQVYFEKEWMSTHILEGHGALCDLYEAKDKHFRSEGDSPAFLHVIGTGLRSHEHPSYGGWGGRFAFTKNVWKSTDREGQFPHSIVRWAPDFQNDWAARADWCVNDFSNSNHPPHVKLIHRNNLTAKPGETITLNARPSSDPDGDQLAFQWWHFQQVGPAIPGLKIHNALSPKTKVTLPSTLKADEEVHLVCTVRDSGSPTLTRYARVIIKIH